MFKHSNKRGWALLFFSLSYLVYYAVQGGSNVFKRSQL